MHLTYRQTCRVCGSDKLSPILDLGPQHLQGSFVKPGKELPPMRKVPLSLVRCDVQRDEKACGLAQLSHSTPTEILYSAYWYRSGTNQTMRTHLGKMAARCVELTAKRSARVLDIGSNDGTLLRSFPADWEKFGVDPSDVAGQSGDDITVVRDLFPSPQITAMASSAPFDVITSIAMFYDLEDPVGFVRDLKKCLAPDGLWVLEMSYMPSMLEMSSYDTICHEHLEYYSLAVLEHIMARAGMKILEAELNSINGGSICCYVTHVDNFRLGHLQPSQRLAELRCKEFEMELDTDKPYRDFKYRIEALREELKALMRRLKNDRKTIHVYGASTKGNTILQYCGIDNTIISCAADRNVEKHGARTLGTDIPIVSEEESRAMGPDYYLVLPWHFREEFLVRERPMLEKGVGMIFPLPKLEIIQQR
jgi:SAM-dependent methyltransferase